MEPISNRLFFSQFEQNISQFEYQNCEVLYIVIFVENKFRQIKFSNKVNSLNLCILVDSSFSFDTSQVIYFLCPQRNFGRHIVITPSVRPALCPVHISYIL